MRPKQQNNHPATACQHGASGHASLTGRSKPIRLLSTRRHNDDLLLPQLTLGMDVLRHLRLFMAFGEDALYIAAAPGTSSLSPKP